MDKLKGKRLWITLAAVVLILLVVFVRDIFAPAVNLDDATPPTTENGQPGDDESDAILKQLFENKVSDVQVEGSGTVIRLLEDDTTGDRHQRFILQLDSGQTLLIAHNIDIAPRLDGLQVGDRVEFYGEYVYSEQGGTIHWTHHDPGGKHVSGWLKWNGSVYH